MKTTRRPATITLVGAFALLTGAAAACHPRGEVAVVTTGGPSPIPRAAPAHDPGARAEVAPVPAVELRATHGSIRESRGFLAMRDPAIRAVAPAAAPGEAELRFVYQGPSEKTAPLASGEIRRQIGLKLRAQDGCNLVYVMWRIEPVQEIVVSVKRNPGKSTHVECGAHGYTDVGTVQASLLRPLRVGEPHVLSARMEGDVLEVRSDGVNVWKGALGRDALGFEGPVGLRSDNGKFDVVFSARRSFRVASLAKLEDG